MLLLLRPSKPNVTLAFMKYFDAVLKAEAALARGYALDQAKQPDERLGNAAKREANNDDEDDKGHRLSILNYRRGPRRRSFRIHAVEGTVSRLQSSCFWGCF